MNLVKLQNMKSNTQKSLEFVYTNNERSKREIKETIKSKRAKHLRRPMEANDPIL